MSESESRPKLTQLENFLLRPESDESKNYIADLLSGGTSRPEDLFVQKFLSVDFWKEMGFSDNEIKVEYPAGSGGRVEITLYVEGQKIAVECKRPYITKNNEILKHNLNGDDITELKDQISQYLLSHSFIIFTNGFHWFFYSRESYRAWVIGSKRKDVQLKPYFEYLTADTLFDKSTHNYILNILKRENILSTLSGIEYESIRHILTDEFFTDLKLWINVVDTALRNAPINLRARTTGLINKLIFVRTMEDVGIIPNGFLSTLWDNKKGVRNSSVDFVDHIDDELSEIYNTELFTSKYVVNEDGEPILKNGGIEFSDERKKNFAYSSLPESFFSAILRPIEPTNLKDTGISMIMLDGKEHYIRSLYWWRFESIPGDILGKAYETYLARERKKLGIYYTPHQITEYITKKTIEIVFDEKITELVSEFKTEKWDITKIKSIAEKISNIRICDPSCGSGSFLIQAIRIAWAKYREIEKIVRTLDSGFDKSGSRLDEYFTDKVGITRYLESLFKIKDKRERIGTLILRHIFGNDKDIKAVDTAKLNIWLECIRLDPNSYRRDQLKGKRHVLPNLELNITKGDSLIGLDVIETEKTLVNFRSSLAPIFNLREHYTESFDKTSLAQDAVRIRNGLQGFVDQDFIKHCQGELGGNLLKILEPTHWSLQHFDAFYNKDGTLKTNTEQGFDVIIGNPPWEVLKPTEDEFFGAIHDEINQERFRLLTKDKKIKFIETSLQDPKIKQEWKTYGENIETQMEYYQKYTPFEHQSGELDGKKLGGDINLYKLFIEQYFRILKTNGICGIVLPANFYSDLSSKGLRELIFNNATVIALYGFDNQKGIFEEIHRQFKFIILIFRKTGITRFFNATFYLRDVNKIPLLDRDSLMYDLDLIKTTSPNSLSLIECKNEMEVKIIKKLFQHPILSDDTDKWKVVFTNEFHMTKHSPLFNQEKKGKMLFEAKMMHQFTHEYLDPRYWIEEEKALLDLKSREEKRLKQSIRKMKTTKKSEEIHLPEIQYDYRNYRLAWRNISRSTDQRTMICTILPPNVFLGNSLNYIRPLYFDGKSYSKSIPPKELVFLCGLLNSFVVDFILRSKISINANMFYVSELPIPRLNDGEYFSQIVEKVGKLICVSSEFDQLKKELGISDSEKDPMKRQKLISEINAYAAKIYNLTKEELEYVLDSFPIVEKSIKESVLFEFNSIS